ncbi:MAG: endonuclease/exonuclease/phosphatase family protein, partial [Chloroflexota bacterium]
MMRRNALGHLISRTEAPNLKTIGNILNALFNTVAALYLLSSLYMLVMRVVAPEAVPLGYTGLYNSLLPPLLVPAFLLLLLGVLLRRWLIVAGSLPIVAAFAVWYGPLLITASPQTPTEDEQVISLMTYNALTFAQPIEGIVGVIEAGNADIVALQEFADPTGAAVLEALEEAYPHQLRVSDQALISRLPLDEGAMIDTYNRSRTADALYAVADVNGTALNVVVFHPPPPGVWTLLDGYDGSRRTTAYNELLLVLSDLSGPTVVLGDFNATDRSVDYWRVREAGYSDTYYDVGTGLGHTFPQAYELDPRIQE